jgi:exodeoxyribonuclease VII large subunit
VVIIGRGGGSIEDLWAFNSEALARAICRSPVPIISAVGHETDFTICDFAADRRAPTPSAAAELAVPDGEELKRKFGNVITRMETLLHTRVKSGREHLKLLSERRVMTTPMAYLDDKRMTLLSLSRDLERSTQGLADKKKQDLVRLSAVLEAVSPLKVIAKGYSAVFADDGKLIRSVKSVSVGDAITFRTVDGTVDATVTEIRETEIKDK